MIVDKSNSRLNLFLWSHCGVVGVVTWLSFSVIRYLVSKAEGPPHIVKIMFSFVILFYSINFAET